MDAKAFVVAPKDYQRPLNVVGERITILASSQMTGGYEIFLQKGSEGSGPNPHSHPWDESFYVTKGEIDFGIGNETQTAVAGTLVHLPAGTTHWFRFGTGGGEMISVTSRAGASKLFAEIDQEVPADRPDLEKLVEISRRNGLRGPQ